MFIDGIQKEIVMENIPPSKKMNKLIPGPMPSIKIVTVTEILC